mgnify:FL=1
MKYFEGGFNLTTKKFEVTEVEDYDEIARKEAFEFLDEIVAESNISKEEVITKITKYVAKQFNESRKNWMNWRYVDKGIN